MNPVPESAALAFLPHMPDVARCELSLQELNQMWRLIEASARMNCPDEARLLLPAMASTRAGFAHLERALVANLVQEKVRHVLAELGTKAQYMIDILVRNLFERTADVGFLASDSVLCRHAAGLDTDPAPARRRLQEYRAKYSVYDQIIVLDITGKVLLQAEPDAALVHSTDPLLLQTLRQEGYVETFRASDLQPSKARALIYSQRMLDPASGAVIGVLCLCFHFEQEMAAVFDTYRDPGKRSNMLLLDAHDRVISSADPLWIPPGALVPTNGDGQATLRMLAGRAYLVRTFASNGYQGYPGPAGWKGQLMIPLELAFRDHGAGALADCAPALLQGLLSHAHSFSPTLHELMTSVTRTTRAIERIVWNGKVSSVQGRHIDNGDNGGTGATRAGRQRLGSVLDQITETGERSGALFSRSIQDLYQTVLASSMLAAEVTSQLLVDMLDRNLYERANDCRWWALSEQLRHALLHAGDAAQTAAAGAVLAQINSLYTVYSRLFIYERGGRIVAATGSQEIVGSHVDETTLGAVQALRSDQEHYAAPFGPSALYGGAPTFIYHAAIRHPQQGANVIGGIGIVFDGAPELLNMLRSGVAGRGAMHAFFVTPDGTVLASTDAAYRPGARLALEPGLLDAAADASVSRIVAHDGQYKIAACTRARGYREFRHCVCDEQEVIGVVLEAFGALRDAEQQASFAPAVRIVADGSEGSDYATFYAGGVLMALDAACIVESVPFSRVRKVAGGEAARMGMLDAPDGCRQTDFIWVFDLGRLTGGQATPVGADSQVILLRHDGDMVGVLVDDLHSVQRFDQRGMSPAPLVVAPGSLSKRLIKANGGTVLIQEICVEQLFALLR